MIRESIARQIGGAAAPRVEPQAISATHPSFARLPLVRGGDDDGMCLIEPAVRCNHCGYCQSFGH